MACCSLFILEVKMVIRNLEIADSKELNIKTTCAPSPRQSSEHLRVSFQFFLLVTLHVVVWTNRMKSYIYCSVNVFSARLTLLCSDSRPPGADSPGLGSERTHLDTSHTMNHK